MPVFRLLQYFQHGFHCYESPQVINSYFIKERFFLSISWLARL
uniref:Uncharacterized protein n=1 Tax=Rhizophora mucronata TaxID=61149 RepID=A0A2P2R2W6_RHIMU